MIPAPAASTTPSSLIPDFCAATNIPPICTAHSSPVGSDYAVARCCLGGQPSPSWYCRWRSSTSTIGTSYQWYRSPARRRRLRSSKRRSRLRPRHPRPPRSVAQPVTADTPSQGLRCGRPHHWSPADRGWTSASTASNGWRWIRVQRSHVRPGHGGRLVGDHLERAAPCGAVQVAEAAPVPADQMRYPPSRLTAVRPCCVRIRRAMYARWPPLQ